MSEEKGNKTDSSSEGSDFDTRHGDDGSLSAHSRSYSQESEGNSSASEEQADEE